MLADDIVNSIMIYMIYKHYERKEHIVAFALVLIIGFYAFTEIKAATIINDNVQSGGNLSLTGAASSIIFGNGWKFTGSSTQQVVVSDTANNTVIILDEN